MSSGLFAKRNVAILLGALLVLGVVLIAVIQGIGKDDVPSDGVAVVDGNEITQADFDTAFQQASSQAGLPQPPAPGDDQYEQVRDQALGSLLDSAWIEGEGERQGVEVTDKEVQDTFTQLKSQNFKTEAEYQQFLQQSGLTQEDIDERVRLQVISQKIQEQITNDTPEVSDEEVREFYDANKAQFEQPETRDIRVILNKDPAQVAAGPEPAPGGQLTRELEEGRGRVLDRSPPQRTGAACAAGSSRRTLRGAAQHRHLRRARGRGRGPGRDLGLRLRLPGRHVTPAAPPPSRMPPPRSRSSSSSQIQQEHFAAFLTDYRDHWVELTICADDFLTERCDNFRGTRALPGPEPHPRAAATAAPAAGCPPPVSAIYAGAPGHDPAFTPATGGQPQKPHPPGEDQAPRRPSPGGAAGAVPGGAGGAPVQAGQ